MSKSSKIWLGIGIVAAMCLCSAVAFFVAARQIGTRVRNAVKTDPSAVAEVGDRIAQFEVPPGYELGMAMSFLYYEMVSIVPTSSASGEMTIMMMQFTDKSMNEEQMKRALQQQSNQPNLQMKVVERRTVTIRGEEVPITISESTSSQNFTLRQWVGVFSGNKGPTMLMIQGSTGDWDEELIDNFIQSIH
jgi:hypothetical protein